MSKYDEIREAYSEYKYASDKYVSENEVLSLIIVDGLRNYLKMPLSYSVNGDFRRYLPFFRIDDDGEAIEEGLYIKALSHFSDGSFKFAFGFTMEIAEGALPKHNLIIPVECKRQKEKVAIDVAGEIFNLTFDGESCPDIGIVHEHIFRKIIEWLKHRPGDGQGSGKMGFTLD